MPSVATVDHDSLVIVPTYNELETLERLVQAVLDQSSRVPFDLLVVDDGSPDGTGDLADFLASERPGRMAVIHRERKLGLGTAYLEGFRYALQRGYAHVFEMDADFSHDPVDLPVLRAALDRYDVVLGSRYVNGGKAAGWSIWRHALSQLGSMYAAGILNLPVHDLTGGFKGFRASALQTLDLDAIKSNGYAFQIEVTYRVFKSGARIVEQPICFGPRLAGRSKLNLGIILEALFIVWRLRLTSRPSPRNWHSPPRVG